MKMYEDYVITNKLNLDLLKMKSSCYKMYDIINKKLNTANGSVGYKDNSGMSPLSTNLFDRYNLLLYTFDEFHDLYEEIRNTFKLCNTTPGKYYIQCWLNIYKKGNFIDWHNHWLPQCNTWHGFYCVDCEPSKTTYRIPNKLDPFDIISENNLLVMSRSDGDQHRTWPWENEQKDRITIAFDIVPANRINNDDWVNHWIPI
jgi:hypothetical protein